VYFEVLPSIGEDGVVLYRLGGLNVKAEMCIFNKRFDAYMQEKFDAGENVCPDIAYHQINKMRDDLPILRHDKFTPYSVATLLNTFYDVKKWQEKKCHTYKIVSLTPKETAGFTLKEKIVKPFMSDENWTQLTSELLKKDTHNTYINPNETKRSPNLTFLA
jgi:hypothetical protein